MAPAAHAEVPFAANTNGPDGAMVEETHLKDSTGAGEGALRDEPDKKDIVGRREDAGRSAQTTSHMPDDLFDDDSDEDDNNDFVPRGKKSEPTETKTEPAGPKRKHPDGASQDVARNGGAEAKKEKSKDVRKGRHCVLM